MAGVAGVAGYVLASAWSAPAPSNPRWGPKLLAAGAPTQALRPVLGLPVSGPCLESVPLLDGPHSVAGAPQAR